MSSLLNTLTQQLGGNAIQQISSQLGTDPASTQAAVGAALPLLLGALGRNAASPDGAAALSNALQQHDGSTLNNLSGFLAAGGNTQDGSAILGHVLGGKQDAVATSLSQVSGLNAGSTSQLLAMLAPVVMGALGKTQREEGLNAGGLANLLSGEQSHADSLLGGLASQLLDANHDGSIADDVVKMGSKLLGGLFGS